MKMKDFDVIGLGLSIMDILTPIPCLPGSNQAFEVSGITIQGGGPVATALVALAKLGARTAYLGTIVNDRWGNMIQEEFEAYGVSTAFGKRSDDGASPVSVILVEPDGSRVILYEKGQLPRLTEQDVTTGLISSAEILHLDGNHPDAAVKAAQLARECGTLVSLDGGAGEGKIRPRMDELLPLVDILIVARHFATKHTGFQDPLRAGPALLSYGARFAVITDGENGCWYWDGEQHLHQPAYKVDVRDTTGAGDTFHGAYLYAFLQKWPPEDCMAFASAVAAIKCTQPGGRKGIPDCDQALAFIEQNISPSQKE
jgi:sulfofructose kinase